MLWSRSQRQRYRYVVTHILRSCTQDSPRGVVALSSCGLRTTLTSSAFPKDNDDASAAGPLQRRDSVWVG
eukprot:scaffold200116_cov29-Prasinocladus_malaysianus.AAC.1